MLKAKVNVSYVRHIFSFAWYRILIFFLLFDFAGSESLVHYTLQWHTVSAERNSYYTVWYDAQGTAQAPWEKTKVEASTN